MCGRYTLTSVDGLVEEFALIAGVQAEPRYNIAPSEKVLAITNRPADERVASFLRWGLIPYWAKDPSIGNRLVNARCETVAEKPSFRQAFQRRRCLIVADGFYEWQRRGRHKTPYYFKPRSGALLAFAGLWERWRAPDDTWLASCTIITTEANGLMRPIHDRMPVIVTAADRERWLEPAPLPRGALDDILAPPADTLLVSHPVSPLVNSVANDTAACIEPVPEQTSLF